MVLKAKEAVSLSNALRFITSSASDSDDGEIIFCGTVPFHPNIIFHHKNVSIIHDTPTYTGGDPAPGFSDYSLEYKVEQNKIVMDKSNQEIFKSICEKHEISNEVINGILM